MTKIRLKLFVAVSIVIAFTLMIFSSSKVAVQAEVRTLPEIKEKMAGISDKEKDILQKLFIMVQEIEDAELIEKKKVLEIENINREIKGLEAKISDEESNYAKKKEDLKKVLQSYQRSGPGSYLEILLSSDNMTTFLLRINTLRDLTRNTGILLQSIESSKENLKSEKAKRSESLALMEVKLKESREALDKKVKLKDEMEKYLASLKEERDFYQKSVADIQQMWGGLKSLFPAIVSEFSKIIEEGKIPPDAFKTTFSLYGIKGSISEKAFNEIIADNPRIPKMEFDFYPGKVGISIPEKNLVLSGRFVITDGHTLKFVADKGSFYGMTLEAGAIGELFRDGYLILDLKSMLGSSTLSSIDILDGNLEFTIKTDFF